LVKCEDISTFSHWNCDIQIDTIRPLLSHLVQTCQILPSNSQIYDTYCTNGINFNGSLWYLAEFNSDLKEYEKRCLIDPDIEGVKQHMKDIIFQYKHGCDDLEDIDMSIINYGGTDLDDVFNMILKKMTEE
jgi:hypothetical protein